MNKLQTDLKKAHDTRMELIPIFNSIFKGTSYWIDKFNTNSKFIPPNQVVELNNFFSRFPTSKLQYESIGHSFLLGNADRPNTFRIVDIRFDNGNGIYWKDIHEEASFESLMMVNPIFIVVLMADNNMYLAIFTMNNHYMNRKSCWQQGGSGNRNRLQNICISSSLKDQRGFPIINGKCSGFIVELNEIFLPK